MEIWIAILVICVMLTIVLLNIKYDHKSRSSIGIIASGYLAFGGTAACIFMFMFVPSNFWILCWLGFIIMAIGMIVGLAQLDYDDPAISRHKVRVTDFQRLLGRNRTERG